MLKILITSREPLNLPSEMLYPVQQLNLPAVSSTIVELENKDAIRLFIDRTQNILPAFTLTSDNAKSIASIYRELDGIPPNPELWRRHGMELLGPPLSVK